MKNVFVFKVWYDESDIDNGLVQERYVLADTEDEAREKLEKHNAEQHAKGFALFHIGKCEILIQEVIADTAYDRGYDRGYDDGVFDYNVCHKCKHFEYDELFIDETGEEYDTSHCGRHGGEQA